MAILEHYSHRYLWRPRLFNGLLLSIVLCTIANPLYAEPVLERIARTGIFNAGTRADVIPFGYRDKKGQLVGFSVDLLAAIHKHLEQHFQRSIKMEVREVRSAQRLQWVQDATIDIECGITTPTWAREQQVDFSIPFFGNGTRIMVMQNTATQLQDLSGKRIGVVAGTTTASILAEHVPAAIPVEVADMQSGFAQFTRGTLDGLANVGIILRAMVESSPIKSKVMLLPRNGIFAYEPMACILPQNDSAWRDFINHSLAELLEGIEEYRGSYMEIYERWFGPRGVVYFPLDYASTQRLAASLIWLR